MTQVAGNPGEWSIGALNDNTGWLDLTSIIADTSFTITGTFVGTISVYASMQSDPGAAKTRFVILPTTYTTPIGPLALPLNSGRYVQFIFTSYTSGTAYVGVNKGVASVGGTPQRVNINVQGTDTMKPTGQFS